MVLSKHNYMPECFTYGGVPLQATKCFNYLGFVSYNLGFVSYNGKFRNLIQGRVLKATPMANMILQAIKTNKNVSVKLAISLFDKQISPILLYGCLDGHCQSGKVSYTWLINQRRPIPEK